jgi:hypothetical protein
MSEPPSAKPEDVEPTNEPIAICPHCMRPVGQFDHFCPNCGGPVTAHASMDPFGQIFSTGRLYQRALSSRPRGIILAGMWLIFAPQVALALWGVIVMIQFLITAPIQHTYRVIVIGGSGMPKTLFSVSVKLSGVARLPRGVLPYSLEDDLAVLSSAS